MKLYQASLLVFSIFLLSLAFIGFTYAASSKTGLSTSQLEEFAQNNILFYDPSQCIGGTSSGICGSNTKEKLWTALRQHFDEVHTAAALGNILHEGGLNPLRWEYKAVNNGNPPTFDSRIDDWNKFYDGTYMNICYDSDFLSWYCIGVGDFAITSRLDEYLQYIKENEPDLFDYFKDPKYTYMEGDSLIDELGEDIYDRLIELEVKYFVEEWIDQGIKETFESYTDVTGAARYYSDKIMACGACHSDSVMSARAASAEEMYEELKGFSCTPKSSSSSSSGSSSSSSSTSDITLIGDSIAVMAEEELQEKFPDAFFTMVGSRHSTSGGACPSDKGGLEILQKLSDGSGTILTQHHNKNSCDEVTIDKNSLKDNVVWELGTNSIGASKETIEKVIKLVGDDRKLFLVTPYNGDSRAKDDTEAIAQMYRDVAEEYDNVYVVDWANAVKDSGYTYVYAEPSMTVHPTDEGKELLAKLISEAVSGSSGCTTYEGEYPQYIQWDEPWGSLPYGPDGGEGGKWNYGNSACGAASMAMLATVATGQDIFPNDIGDLLEEQYNLGKIPGGHSPYYNHTGVDVLDPIVGEHYGFEVISESYSDYDDAEEKIRNYLKDGYMIHLTGAGTDFFGPDGHVIGIYSIDQDDNVMIANSAWTLNGKWPLKDVASHLLWGVFTAIKGNNNSKNTCDTSNLCKDGNPGTGTETSMVIGPIHESSVDVPCDPRTIDIGTRDDAYYNGSKHSIRLCSIPNIPDRDGNGDGHNDGNIHVNSRVSGAFYSLAEEYNKRCGSQLIASEGFRTWDEQKYFYDTLGPTWAATPGYSNHQEGLAVDFDNIYVCSKDSSVASGGWANEAFLAQFGLRDGRSFNENWHIEAVGE